MTRRLRGAVSTLDQERGAEEHGRPHDHGEAQVGDEAGCRVEPWRAQVVGDLEGARIKRERWIAVTATVRAANTASAVTAIPARPENGAAGQGSLPMSARRGRWFDLAWRRPRRDDRAVHRSSPVGNCSSEVNWAFELIARDHRQDAQLTRQRTKRSARRARADATEVGDDGSDKLTW
jgi:hypothetical protein